MTESTKFTAGQAVYVVPQNDQRVPFAAVVVSVGRKYGHILFYGCDAKFDPRTGRSCHPHDSNARLNKWGFDVYRSREAYEKIMEARSQFARLSDRLRSHAGAGRLPLRCLPPWAVTQLHAVLDAVDAAESKAFPPSDER